MTSIILDYQEIIKNQATINVGCIGHVSEGKSTVVRRLTGIATQRHKSEQERNITINLGYANFKIWKDLETDELFYTGSDVDTFINPTNDNETCLVKHVSFVDCPGHDSFMSTMISGTSVMNCAFLLIAADNKVIPQAQTYEHLIAISNTDINNILVLQNKIDLLKNENDALNNLKKIINFLKGSIAEDSTILPISAQMGTNVNKICQYAYERIPDISKDLNKPLFLPIIRSFDANKPKTKASKLSGGIIGGSIIRGVLNVGDYIEIRPGILQTIDNKVCCFPIITRVESIQSEKNSIKYAVPGGLIGIGTSMDPYFSGSNRLVGQLAGKIGSLPEIFDKLNVKIKRLKRGDIEKQKFTKNEKIMVCINSCTVSATIKVKNKEAVIKLDKPICCEIGKKCALLKNIAGKYTLCYTAKILDGKKFDNIVYRESISKFTNTSDVKYEIVNNIQHTTMSNTFDYNTLIKNFNFKKNKADYRIKYDSLLISRAARQIVVENMKTVLFSIHKQINNGYNYVSNFENFFTNEINKPCHFSSGSQFIMSGKFSVNQVENLVDKYIDKYVRCPVCYSNSTFLCKENRIVKIVCNLCNSSNAIIDK